MTALAPETMPRPTQATGRPDRPEPRTEPRSVAVHEDVADGEGRITRETLRGAAPALVSVLLLFGVLMAGAFALRELLDLGLWLVSAS